MDLGAHNEYTKNREEVRIMRVNYLKWVSHHRDNEYRIYYQDETSVFKNMASTKIWKDFAAEAMETDYKLPAGEGD